MLYTGQELMLSCRESAARGHYPTSYNAFNTAAIACCSRSSGGSPSV